MQTRGTRRSQPQSDPAPTPQPRGPSPGRKSRVANLYGVPAPAPGNRPSSQRKHEARHPPPAQSREPIEPRPASDPVFGGTAPPALLVDPPVIDFGQVGLRDHPRAYLRVSPPEQSGPVTLTSIHAVDPLGAATFRAVGLQRGTTLRRGDTMAIPFACHPATPGLIERELIICGTVRPLSGPPQPLEQRVRVRAHVVKEEEVGLAKIATAATAGAGQKAHVAPHRQPEALDQARKPEAIVPCAVSAGHDDGVRG